MLLTGFVIAQLMLDVVLVLLVTWAVTRKGTAPARPPAVPPAWYGDLVALAQDLLVVTEPVLDALEGQHRRPPPEARDTRPARDGRRKPSPCSARAWPPRTSRGAGRDRKSTRLNSSHSRASRMPSSA